MRNSKRASLTNRRKNRHDSRINCKPNRCASVIKMVEKPHPKANVNSINETVTVNKQNEISFGDVESRFKKAGIRVKKLDTVDEIKNSSWIMPTNDRKGMISIIVKGSAE